MNRILTDLLGQLDLEEIEQNIFRGESRDIGTPSVFGGQVLGQALSAAHRTIEGRSAHSLHAYFLRRGDVKAPIVYQVDRARDGGSFSNRRVVAIQHGQQIFNMTASFQREEDGLEHQAGRPDVPGPDELRDITEFELGDTGKLPEKLRGFLNNTRPFHVRPASNVGGKAGSLEPVKYVWMKSVDTLPDNSQLHKVLLAYISDYQLLGTATLPHGDLHTLRGKLQMASLDHAMWFHRSCRADEWLLFSYDSPSASGARGLARGQVFNQDGDLVVSIAQEGLIRIRD